MSKSQTFYRLAGLFVSVIASLFLGTAAQARQAGTPAQKVPETPEPETVSAQESVTRGEPIVLFDGTSLEGWGNKDGTPNEGWSIEEGTLFRARRTGHLYYSQQFDDFELTFQWKLEAGGNSGVKYRVRDYTVLFNRKRSLGCEFQCIDNDAKNKFSTGSLYALYAPNENQTVNPAGEWNSGKIVVCGNDLQHWLNGEQVMTAEVGGEDWLRRVAASKFNGYRKFGQNRSGQIFLQDHGNPVWFRNIVLTPLVCDQTNPLDDETPVPDSGIPKVEAE